MKTAMIIIIMLLAFQCPVLAEPFTPIGGNTDLDELAMKINSEIDDSRNGVVNGNSFLSNTVKLFMNIQDKGDEFTSNIVRLLYPFGDIESGDVKVNF
jgi:hypothetical protein